jgi:hypothetical protein
LPMQGVERAEISFEEIKVCTWRYALCLFCIHCEEKIDLEASRYGVLSHVRARS